MDNKIRRDNFAWSPIKQRTEMKKNFWIKKNKLVLTTLFYKVNPTTHLVHEQIKNEKTLNVTHISVSLARERNQQKVAI